ncbi:uncharacterized protein PFL1_03399 [Pseudozyma flocculosa PF-1]|uniref:Related to LTV1 - low-temperature viability protein n=2 Tax=Pseudozyma flocculosa TaxID=84751 RepID=A0A5C3F8W8_9BASI|nr:uncharacterized protein PFL1_03399 [Pseudozyma flocculosa PF-1]EPQ29111.1 hypothetical protein PFL1_03399 [Pseudozyma flocculosa PF-1]SPO40105.1 related to LTV1 - low-temperature viability protein [Pseudozyma flocculosa]
MPPKKTKAKSAFRSDKAQHFQVVHRSQRDPLINDPDAGQHVLKAVNAPNSKGKTRAQLEQDERILYGNDGKPLRTNVGEAALYGVYYDDTEYDYMQHLRPIRDSENSRRGGVDEQDDTEAILIAAAPKKAPRQKGDGFALKEGEDGAAPGPSSRPRGEPQLSLPASAFASKEERPFSYTSHLNVEPSLQGFQPDMDPHLRQALEALDDEAFVDGDLEDDFFADIAKGGEWDGEVDAQADAWRELPPEGDESIWMDPAQRAQQQLEDEGKESLSLEARVALFKKAQEMERALAAQQSGAKAKTRAGNAGSDDEAGDDGEDRDQLRSLPPASRAGTAYTAGGSVLGKKGKPGAMARRAASTRAGSVGGGSTAWSMTSSSMSRNKGLTDLDDRFDKVGRLYGIREDFDPSLDNLSAMGPDEFEDEDDDDDEGEGEEGEEVSREDFENIMDDFLDRYEVIAGRLKENLGAKDATGAEKLDLLRKALGAARIDGKDWEGRDKDVGKGTEESLGAYDDYDSGDDDDGQLDLDNHPALMPRSAQREKWDVETVLTTKTNLENHPRTISARESVVGTGRNSALPKKIANGGSGRPLGSGATLTSSYSQRPNAAAFLDDDERLPKIRVNPRTGFPEIVGYSKPRNSKTKAKAKAEADAEAGAGEAAAVAAAADDDVKADGPDSGDDTAGEQEGDDDDDDGFDSDATEGAGGHYGGGVTVARDRHETKEEKKARKAAVKAAKQSRRTQKSQTKKVFAHERKLQARAESGRKAAEGGPSGMRLV